MLESMCDSTVRTCCATLAGVQRCARLHEAQRVLKVDHAGKDHRRKLADVEASARRRLCQRRQAVLGPQALHCRQPRDEHSLSQPHDRREQACTLSIRKML